MATMKEQQFEDGAWVKEQNGTQGMTIVSHLVDNETGEFLGEVRCRFKNSVGEPVESNFWEADLVKL